MRNIVLVVLILFCLPAIAYSQCGCGSNGGPCGSNGGCNCGCGGGSAPPEFGSNLPFNGFGVKMHSRVPLSVMNADPNTLGSAIWGWTDATAPGGPRNYALFGLNNGTSFVDVTNPANPVYVGRLPSATGTSVWRELKTYQNYAYVISDGNGNHGMQVFDLTNLRNYNGTPITFSANTRYYSGNNAGAFSNAHTIHINEDTGYAYVFGTSTHSGGVHVVNINNPLAPTFAGGYSAAGYVHDGQSVVYQGPDTRFTGQEILFGANSRSSANVADDMVQILNVSNKSNIVQLGQTTHPNARYTHQGWLTEDHRYFVVNDELDEYYDQSVTKSHIYDVSNLTNPVYRGSFTFPNNSKVIDHNLFIKGDLIFASNYVMGLRVLRMGDLGAPGGPEIEEIAWFDTYPADDAEKSFNGLWGNYPFFDNGIIIAGDRQNGLFVLELDLAAVPEPGTYALIATGALAGLGFYRYRRKAAKKVLEQSVEEPA